MKNYKKPVAEVIVFENADIITASLGEDEYIFDGNNEGSGKTNCGHKTGGMGCKKKVNSLEYCPNVNHQNAIY